LLLLIPVLAITQEPVDSQSILAQMKLVPGGSFRMGDLFADGESNELPLHAVQVDDYYIHPYEVTVRQYRTFVEATGYLTRAERFDSREEQQARFDKLVVLMQSGEETEESRALYAEFLNSGGCFQWVAEARFFNFSLDCNWRTPLFEQVDDAPVIALAWVDAASFCNWLSEQEDLPPAYNVETGEILDADGNPTEDITRVKGCRLPTEAEWEYAAREGGKEVRFGNGSKVARGDELNIDASVGDYPYCEPGAYQQKTMPIGSYSPNGLGLYDMSGNAWEWCSDYYEPYTEAEQTNPHGNNKSMRVLRGGRWGGDAREARVFGRSPYDGVNRCNNSGFRIARSR